MVAALNDAEGFEDTEVLGVAGVEGQARSDCKALRRRSGESKVSKWIARSYPKWCWVQLRHQRSTEAFPRAGLSSSWVPNSTS